MTKENDSRREELAARRYHVELCMDYGDGCVHSGEFYYDSLPAARRFVRKQYADWSWGFGLGEALSSADWKEVWGHGALSFTLKDEDGRDCSFFASLRDTAQPSEPGEPMWIDCDMTKHG